MTKWILETPKIDRYSGKHVNLLGDPRSLDSLDPSLDSSCLIWSLWTAPNFCRLRDAWSSGLVYHTSRLVIGALLQQHPICWNSLTSTSCWTLPCSEFPHSQAQSWAADTSGSLPFWIEVSALISASPEFDTFQSLFDFQLCEYHHEPKHRSLELVMVTGLHFLVQHPPRFT